MLATASDFCTTMNLQTPAICNDTVYAIVPDVIKIMRTVNMSTAQVCYFLFDDSCNEIAEDPSHLWKISLPPYPKPAAQKIPPTKGGVPQLKVLHLTDTHYDPLYAVGSNAACPEPMCCRASSTIVNSTFNAAGKWGAFKCDVPKRTFEHVLDFISQKHKVIIGSSQGNSKRPNRNCLLQDIDYVIWTGDLLPHDIWNGDRDKLIPAIEENIQLVMKKLPGVQVLPAIGNHERIPVNL